MLGLAPGCSGGSQDENLEEEQKLAPVTAICNRINVTIDPRIELMAIVQYLSEYRNNMTSIHILYRHAVERHFEDYSGHKAVKLYEDLGPMGFANHVPAAFALSLTEEFDLDKSVQLPEELLLLGEEKLQEFAAALKDFSAKSDFPDFFSSQREFYSQSVEEIVANIGEHDFISESQAYFGSKYDSYSIHPVILYRNGAHYAVQLDRGSRVDAYNIIPPVRRSGNTQMAYVDEGIFRSWQRHDYNLSYTKRVSESFRGDIMQFELLYFPLRDETLRQNSRTWYSFANEHIARAVTVRMAYADNEEAGDRALAEELRLGFVYIEPILKKLVEYENNRDEYPDMTSFYPELLKAFQGLN